MSKRYDPAAEGAVAPENMPSYEYEDKSSKEAVYDPTAEGLVAKENTTHAKAERVITTDTGTVKIGNYTFPSKKITGTAADRERQKRKYIQECREKVFNSNWIAPSELAGDLLADYFNGVTSKEECEERALNYMEKYGLYDDPESHTDKRYAIRASVVACQYSNRLTHLDIFEDHGVQDEGGNAVLTCADCRIGENLFSFGICNSPNAVVQNSPLITVKDGNRSISGHMCMMKVAMDWTSGSDVHVHIWNAKTKRYEKCLPEDAITVCSYGAGKIRIVEIPLIINYEVRFINGLTGDVFDVQSVEEGTHAVPPTPPAVDGYKFYKWDSRKYRYVMNSVDIEALYNPENYADTKDVLSDEELEGYMAMLPPDLNETRRAVIQYALESVGTIPYYYGGKSSVQGYNKKNDYCKPGITPDKVGRTVRGLDCSGWIYWVAWTVTGEDHGHVSGTWHLSIEGKDEDIKDLKPGDIIGKSNDHVIMFLASKGDDIVYIHESGGGENINVKVENRGILNKKYSYKRNLDSWYENVE